MPCLVLAALLAASTAASPPPRAIAITIDDLPAAPASMATARERDVTKKLLATLRAHRAPAVGFVIGDRLTVGGERRPERAVLLEQWLDAGHELGNHGYSHLSANRVPLGTFEADVVRGDEVLRPLLARRHRTLRWFRHPFLQTGRDLETRARLDAFLSARGYRVAPVTVDSSEWIFASAYERAIGSGDRALQDRIAAAYLEYMLAKVAYFDRQARALFGRDLRHVLLLHANALNADHLGALLGALENRGWGFVRLEDVLADPAYAHEDAFLGPGGISWVHRWALTERKPLSFYDGEPLTPGWVLTLAGEEHEFLAKDYVGPAAR